MAGLGYLSEEQFADLVNAAASGGAAVESFNTRTGAVTLSSGDVTTALTFTPYNATNPSGYITGINSSMVTTALGYTPTSVTGLTGTQSVSAFKTGLTLVKADVGLGSVDNTTDAGKPVSTAQQTALDLKLDDSQSGTFGLTMLGTANLAAAKTALAYVKADVGLGSADDTADAAKNVLSATKFTTGRTIGITGDGTWSSGSFDGSANVTAAITFATVNANVGTFGSATKASIVTVNAKGLVTAASEATVTPAWGSISGTPTTLSGYGITDAQGLDADLITIAGLTATTDNFIVSVSSAWASRTPAQVRTTLGLVIGTNVQAYDADLATWAGITPGSGVDTFLATPSSANLLAALTTSTGTGSAVFSISPTFTGTVLAAAVTTSGDVTIAETNAAVNLKTANASSGQVRFQNAAGTGHWYIYETTGAAGEQGNLNLSDWVAGTIPAVISATGIEPGADNTFYLGRNNDDSPKAWKGIIFKDQAGTGKYYRLEVNNNALLLVDLTD